MSGRSGWKRTPTRRLASAKGSERTSTNPSMSASSTSSMRLNFMLASAKTMGLITSAERSAACRRDRLLKKGERAHPRLRSPYAGVSRGEPPSSRPGCSAGRFGAAECVDPALAGTVRHRFAKAQRQCCDGAVSDMPVQLATGGELLDGEPVGGSAVPSTDDLCVDLRRGRERDRAELVRVPPVRATVVPARRRCRAGGHIQIRVSRCA